jgi:hypothetical protein
LRWSRYYTRHQQFRFHDNSQCDLHLTGRFTHLWTLSIWKLSAKIKNGGDPSGYLIQIEKKWFGQLNGINCNDVNKYTVSNYKKRRKLRIEFHHSLSLMELFFPCSIKRTNCHTIFDWVSKLDLLIGFFALNLDIIYLPRISNISNMIVFSVIVYIFWSLN